MGVFKVDFDVYVVDDVDVDVDVVLRLRDHECPVAFLVPFYKLIKSGACVPSHWIRWLLCVPSDRCSVDFSATQWRIQ